MHDGLVGTLAGANADSAGPMISEYPITAKLHEANIVPMATDDDDNDDDNDDDDNDDGDGDGDGDDDDDDDGR